MFLRKFPSRCKEYEYEYSKPQVLHCLIKHSLMIADEKQISDRTKQIKEHTIKLLCTICTVKTNRFYIQFYIPGETNLVERLRKESFDKGIFATLTQVFQQLQSSQSNNEIKQYVREKVLNLLELNDLVYHASVIESLIEKSKNQPIVHRDVLMQRQGSSEYQDDSTDGGNSSTHNNQNSQSTPSKHKNKASISSTIPKQLQSPKPALKSQQNVLQSASHNNQNYQTNRAGDKIGNSGLIGTANQFTVSAGLQKENIFSQQKDEKISANEIWKEPSEPDFPACLLDKLQSESCMNKSNHIENTKMQNINYKFSQYNLYLVNCTNIKAKLETLLQCIQSQLLHQQWFQQ